MHRYLLHKEITVHFINIVIHLDKSDNICEVIDLDQYLDKTFHYMFV